jgi:hypothetical protein
MAYSRQLIRIFTEAIEDLRGEDFDIRHATPDPFSYLGNGELEW